MTRAAVITGGATGIGAAIARALAARGWRVLVNYTKSEAEARATAEACRAAGGEALVARGDVARDADCQALVAQAVAAWGRLDALVNNAGITKFVPAKDLESLTGDDFERIFAVNLKSAYQMARAAAPSLTASGAGAIVNISSHSAFTGLGSSMAYAASKGALNTLTLSLARALAPEVRVNAVCPGFVDTRWTRGTMDEAAYEAFKARVAESAPLKRMTMPEDVAEAALWFIEGGRAITGQFLVVDGGNHLNVNLPLKR
ncbi:MAG: SDR family NAD(P)-dependent oxidoreductase [Dongiaceae bacterium]